jgi:hypothetical protein
MLLTLDRETAETIGNRVNIPTEIAEKRLEKMVEKGLIFSFQPRAHGKCAYPSHSGAGERREGVEQEKPETDAQCQKERARRHGAESTNV